MKINGKLLMIVEKNNIKRYNYSNLFFTFVVDMILVFR